jgi:hypothetical protein
MSLRPYEMAYSILQPYTQTFLKNNFNVIFPSKHKMSTEGFRTVRECMRSLGFYRGAQEVYGLRISLILIDW